MTENLPAVVEPAPIVDSGTAAAMARYNARRFDRWENATNRFGGNTDPMTVTEFQPGIRLSRGQLEAIYEYDWVTGKIIDIPPADSTRKWLNLTHEDDPGRAKDAKKEIDRWNLRGLVKEAQVLARLHGGSLLVMGAFDGGDVQEPLVVERIREVQFIHVVDRWMAYPLTFDQDPMSPDFGAVETYIIHRVRVTGVQTTIVHASRVIRFDGRYVPPLRRLRNFGWQNSYITRLFEVVKQFGVSTQALSSTLQDHVLKKIKIHNLQDLIASGQFDIISTRLTLMAQEMAINNLMVYGDDEEVEKMGTPIGALPKIAELFIDYVSAAADIPRSRLFQNVTGHLGGDPGKNDLRVHYDNIESAQETELRDPVQRAINMLLVPLGFQPGEIGFTWNPLWQMTDTEQAEIELKTAQRDLIYIQAGVVEPEEVAISRFSGEVPDLKQMSIDIERREQALEDLKKVDLIKPEVSPEEMLAMETEAQLQLQRQTGGGPGGPDDDRRDTKENDAISRKISKLHDEHPDWAQDKLVAVAHSMLGLSRKDAANLTNKAGDDKHAHTFDIDFETGNGQTVDTLDEGEAHVHMIRSWRMMPAGRDSHTHLMSTISNVPGDMSGRK